MILLSYICCFKDNIWLFWLTATAHIINLMFTNLLQTLAIRNFICMKKKFYSISKHLLFKQPGFGLFSVLSFRNLKQQH